uniref:Uncharacterized protein n=1 Tax=Amphimedon queenslandica TaxID=400682 RepID=A0A1X7U5A3_AMPQE
MIPQLASKVKDFQNRLRISYFSLGDQKLANHMTHCLGNGIAGVLIGAQILFQDLHHSRSGSHPAIRIKSIRNSSNGAHRKEMECETDIALVAINSNGSSDVTYRYISWTMYKDDTTERNKVAVFLMQYGP